MPVRRALVSRYRNTKTASSATSDAMESTTRRGAAARRGSRPAAATPDVVDDVGRRHEPRPDLRPEWEHRDREGDAAGEDEHAADELHDRPDLAEAQDARREECADRVERRHAHHDDDRGLGHRRERRHHAEEQPERDAHDHEGQGHGDERGDARPEQRHQPRDRRDEDGLERATHLLLTKRRPAPHSRLDSHMYIA